MATLGTGGWRSVPRRVALGLEILFAYVMARRRLHHGGPLRTDTDSAAELPPRRTAAAYTQPLSAAAAARLGWQARRVLQVTLRRQPTCLVLSLVLLRLLHRRGTEGRLVIGVTGSQDFAAHAWVEVNGQAVLPTEAGFHRLLEVAG